MQDILLLIQVRGLPPADDLAFPLQRTLEHRGAATCESYPEQMIFLKMKRKYAKNNAETLK